MNRSRIPLKGLFLGFSAFTVSNFYRFCKGYYDLPDVDHE